MARGRSSGSVPLGDKIKIFEKYINENGKEID